MTVLELEEVIKDLLKDCEAIRNSKGISYSGLEDKLGNFKRVAKSLNMEPEQVWYVYCAKHLDSIASYIRGEYKDSEPIRGRICDVLNYMFLLAGILKEKGKLDSIPSL